MNEVAGKVRLAGKANEILEVFTRNVAELGYDGTNFREIANELSISQGTIVHHYGTKHRLLAALHESYMHQRLAEASLIAEKFHNPEQQLAGLLFAFILYQQHDRTATVAFQREVMRLRTIDAEPEGRGLRAQYLALVRAIIAKGVEQGKFRDIDIRVESLLLFGSAQWAYTWFDPRGEVSVMQIGAALVDLVLGSLLVRRQLLASLKDPDGTVAQTALAALMEPPNSAITPTASSSAGSPSENQACTRMYRSRSRTGLA